MFASAAFDQIGIFAISLCLSNFIGTADLLMVTFDTLRFDVADRLFHEGRLPVLQSVLPSGGWQRRHSPASFTYAAHHAFFAGFLPTPASPGPHSRLFASKFAGSETTTDGTFVFDEPTLPEALSQRGYRTMCIGGTGFFNLQDPLGKVLPNLFDEAFWDASLGVADPDSHLNQVDCAIQQIQAAGDQLTFTFVNIAALHQPNWFYDDSVWEPTSGKERPKDTLESHAAALVAVDQALAPLIELCRHRRPTFCIFCSDHGTAYGEDGYVGHRLAHDVVWNVPYAEFLIS